MAYCRVSTLQESQEVSLDSQASFFREYIEADPRLIFAGIYADRKSGTTEHRSQFQKMIEDAQQGQIDRVVCKSISRFSRKAVDVLRYCELLESCGVTVVFLRENLDTANKSATILLRLMAALAQSESQSISENIRLASRKRCQAGKYSPGSHQCFGYRAAEGKLRPDENAPAVRLIYTLFLEGHSCRTICQRLKALGIKNRQGRDLTVPGIRYILKNETYAGDKALLKHQRRSLLDSTITGENIIYLKDDHTPIITREIWAAAQRKWAEKRKSK